MRFQPCLRVFLTIHRRTKWSLCFFRACLSFAGLYLHASLPGRACVFVDLVTPMPIVLVVPGRAFENTKWLSFFPCACLCLGYSHVGLTDRACLCLCQIVLADRCYFLVIPPLLNVFSCLAKTSMPVVLVVPARAFAKKKNK